MGHTIWVDVQGRGKGELPRDNSIMLRLKDELDRLADKLQVAKLSQFYDYSVLEEEYADVAEEAGLMDAVKATSSGKHGGAWFEAGPALAAVRTIHDHLLQHPEDLGFKADRGRSHWPDHLMDELKSCRATLEAALSGGRKFRFLIVA